MSKGEFLFVISHTECHNYYSTIDIMNPPPFHPGFLAWTKKLSNSNVSDEEVLKFVEYFGSHFFTEVTFGAKFIQKHKVSQSARLDYQPLFGKGARAPPPNSRLDA